MSLTPTGAAIIVLGLYYFLFRGDRLMPALVFFAPFSATAVINFSNYGMGPAVVFMLLLLLRKVISGEIFQRLRVSRDHQILFLLVGGFAVVSVVSLLANAANRDLPPIEVTQTAYILFGVCVTLVISLELARPERLEAAVSAFRASAVFVSVWGLVQAVCIYGGVPYPAFLFNNSTSHFADMFDQRAGQGVVRIASVAVEPSFMAVSLMMFCSFGATVLAVDPRFRTRGWTVPVGLGLLVILASTSTTGYFGLAVLAFLLGLRRPGLMLAIAVPAVLVLAAVVVALPGFGEALYQVTLGKSTTGSYVDRTSTVWETFRVIGQRPWLGGGWGSNFSFSILTILPANGGAIGTVWFTLAYAGTILASRMARRAASASRAAARPLRWAYAEGAENALLVFLGQSVVAGFHFVVADFWCLWGLGLAAASCLTCGERLALPAVRRRAVELIRPA